jgi:hypothetical protein
VVPPYRREVGRLKSSSQEGADCGPKEEKEIRGNMAGAYPVIGYWFIYGRSADSSKFSTQQREKNCSASVGAVDPVEEICCNA